jgi:hypothetical protein
VVELLLLLLLLLLLVELLVGWCPFIFLAAPVTRPFASIVEGHPNSHVDSTANGCQRGKPATPRAPSSAVSRIIPSYRRRRPANVGGARARTPGWHYRLAHRRWSPLRALRAGLARYRCYARLAGPAGLRAWRARGACASASV